MTAFKHILVGIDFSRASEEAFATALRLARRDEARVTAVHVAHDMVPEQGWSIPWESTTGSGEQARLVGLLREELETLVSEFPTSGLEVEHIVALGNPAIRIPALATDMGCDLIVIAPTGKGLMQRVLIGSTTEAIVRRAKVPVWIARPGYSRRLSRILIGVDFTPPSAAALDVAVDQARRDQASLDIVHAYRDPGTERIFSVASEEDQQHYQHLILSEEKQKFETFCHNHAPPSLVEGLKVQTHLLSGKPSRILLGHAEDIHADLIVVGRHSHGLLHDLFIGTTAERLMRQSVCGMLVI